MTTAQTTVETPVETPVPESCPPAWAHSVGALALGGPAPVPTDWQTLADRMMVCESASRYAMTYDERRTDVMRELFTEDVVFAYCTSGGGYGETAGREEVIAWLEGIMATQDDQRRHLCGNLVVEQLDATDAVVTCYFSLTAAAATAELVTSGFYRFTLRKPADRWLISHVYDGLDRPF